MYFKKLRNNLAHKLKPIKPATMGSIVSFEKAKNIGILFTINALGDILAAQKCIDTILSSHKKVMALGLILLPEIENRKPEATKNLVMISAKNVNFLLEANGAEVEAFLNEPFDFIICNNPDAEYTLLSLANKANTNFIVGTKHSKSMNLYNFMMPESENFYAEILNYIKLIQ